MSLFRQVVLSVLFTGALTFAGAEVSADSGTSGDDLTVYGGAVFYNRPELDSVVLVDFPFTLSRHEFEFLRSDSLAGDCEARVFARLTIFGVDGVAIDSAESYFSTVARDKTEAQIKGYRLFNSVSMYLRPGVYSGRLTVTDVIGKRHGSVTYHKIIVEPSSRDHLDIGGQCLAYSISYVGDAAPGDRLVRNGFRVLPNPLRVFGTQDTTAFLYAEVYNLTWRPKDSSSFETKYAVIDDAGAVFRNLGAEVLPTPGPTAVVVKSFSLAGWPAGTYRLQLVARDLASDQVDTAETAFGIIPPEPEPTVAATTYDADLLDSLPLQSQLHLIHYLLTPLERSKLTALTDVGKQSYVRQYWQEHDSDPLTRVNETRRLMYDRYLMANHLFSTDETRTDGWRTDRGRIYMVYGPWDSRDDIQTPRTGSPFEVWHYYAVEDGVVFVFEDSRGDGNYRQVHSTANSERFNATWDDIVKNEDYNLN